jgi:hypothetical protein
MPGVYLASALKNRNIPSAGGTKRPPRVTPPGHPGDSLPLEAGAPPRTPPGANSVCDTSGKWAIFFVAIERVSRAMSPSTTVEPVT